MNELLKLSITAVLGIVGLVAFLSTGAMSAASTGRISTPFGDPMACAMSPYNTYSNSTQGYSYWWGKCYVQVTDYYMTKKECGFLGFSCYEASEAHSEPYTGEVCFKLKNGERC